MIADSVVSGSGKKRCYYSCKNRKTKRASDKTRCTKKNISKESIEAAVMQIVSDFIWDEEMIQQYISVAESMDSKVTVNPRVAELEKAIRNHKERVCRADDAYMDTGDKKWLEISKEESKAMEQFESELREITKLSKHSKNSKDFIEEINDLRDLWIELQKTPEGRTNIVKSFIERVEVFDSSPDDPDKYKLKIIIKTDSKSNYYAEVEAETNLLSRKQNTNGHQASGIRTYPTTKDWFGYPSFYGKINALRLSDFLLKMKWFVLQNKMNIIAPMLSRQRGDYL